MLVFGAPVVMKKSPNQKFSIIKLENLLEKISNLLSKDLNKKIEFNQNYFLSDEIENKFLKPLIDVGLFK